ncbi:hypothetical protein AURDEDRAFT_165494 [Auricularia subglabra TFB-10046 SS5]|nr:hypothetical protein AURDEDRAFT_165494 [Auricularia subglabra TFB-10046 SS5]
MPLLHIYAQFDLYYPVVAPSGRDFVFATYLSQVNINGSVFPIIAIHHCQRDHPAVCGLHAYYSRGALEAVRALHHGIWLRCSVVASGRIADFRCPAGVVVDLTVERSDRWPHTPTTIRNTPLIIGGSPSDWVDGKLALDVHEVWCNYNGSPPTGPLAVFPNPFQLSPTIDNFAMFDNAPPPYSQADSADSPCATQATRRSPVLVSPSPLATGVCHGYCPDYVYLATMND